MAAVPAWRPIAAERMLVDTALFMAALLLLSAGAALVDPRELAGSSVWAKPLKFQLSLALHCLTLAMLIPLLPPGVREGWTVRGLAVLTVVMSILEIVYITLQSARGRGSHYNLDTPFEAMAYRAMGVGAVTLVVAAFVLGLVVWWHRATVPSRGFALGAALGLGLGGLATLLIAGYLASLPGHFIGPVPAEPQGLPFLGWSTQVGDLRPAHFLATHMMQLFPLAGLAADRLRPERPLGWLLLLVGIYLVVLAAAAGQALAGRPLLAW